MCKTKIYLIRHAETIGNIEYRLTGRNDYEITQNGNESVEKLTQELKDIKFQKAFSSTAERTRKTIQPIAEKNNIVIQQLEGLSEMYFGIYDGWKWEDVNKKNSLIKKIQNDCNLITGIPEQETMEEVANRMFDIITKICKENLGNNLLICSHGVAIEAFLRKIKSIPFSEQREKYCQHNVAINELEYENGIFHILRLADIAYLKS